MHRIACTIGIIALLIATWTNAHSTALTFEGLISGQIMSFTVIGGETVWDAPYEPSALRNYESAIGSISEWSLFNERSLPAHLLADNSYRQTMLAVGPSNDTSNLRYHELLTGYSSQALEVWSHEINIRGTFQTPLLFDGLIGLQNAFTYEESLSYARNYTFDGSTVPTFERNDRVSGFLTLTAVDYTPGHSASHVPEPSTLLLLGSGLAMLAGWRRKLLYYK